MSDEERFDLGVHEVIELDGRLWWKYENRSTHSPLSPPPNKIGSYQVYAMPIPEPDLAERIAEWWWDGDAVTRDEADHLFRVMLDRFDLAVRPEVPDEVRNWAEVADVNVGDDEEEFRSVLDFILGLLPEEATDE